jgi:glycosyltransferase involved in cell wall biosynthesis
VGRIEPEKNPLLLADVLQLLRERDARWRLEVIGEGRDRSALERRAEELGVVDSLELTGYVEAGEPLWQRYRSSHAFLHVSLTEGVPSVLFEAQAAGLPVVATDVGGVRTIVEHGRTGLLVPPRDAPAAASAVTQR